MKTVGVPGSIPLQRTVEYKEIKERKGRGQYYRSRSRFGTGQVWRPYGKQVIQHYGKTAKQTTTAWVSARIEFYGNGKDMHEAIRMLTSYRRPRADKHYLTVDATEFLNNPDYYSEIGEWDHQRAYKNYNT